MPYTVRKIPGTEKYGVYKIVGRGAKAKLKLKSRHATRAKAMAAVSLLRGIEHGWRPTGKPKRK